MLPAGLPGTPFLEPCCRLCFVSSVLGRGCGGGTPGTSSPALPWVAVWPGTGRASLQVMLRGAQVAGEAGRPHSDPSLRRWGCGGDQAPRGGLTALTLLCSHPPPLFVCVSRRLAGVGRFSL